MYQRKPKESNCIVFFYIIGCFVFIFHTYLPLDGSGNPSRFHATMGVGFPAADKNLDKIKFIFHLLWQIRNHKKFHGFFSISGALVGSSAVAKIKFKGVLGPHFSRNLNFMHLNSENSRGLSPKSLFGAGQN